MEITRISYYKKRNGKEMLFINGNNGQHSVSVGINDGYGYYTTKLTGGQHNLLDAFYKLVRCEDTVSIDGIDDMEKTSVIEYFAGSFFRLVGKNGIYFKPSRDNDEGKAFLVQE